MTDVPEPFVADPDELVLYAIVSLEAVKAMKGNRGKLVNQGGHAYTHAWWDADERFFDVARRYRYSQAAVKVTLKVDETQTLEDLEALFEPVCGVSLVEDAGRTVFEGKTVTYLGVGPITRSQFEALAPGLRPLL